MTSFCGRRVHISSTARRMRYSGLSCSSPCRGGSEGAVVLPVAVADADAVAGTEAGMAGRDGSWSE